MSGSNITEKFSYKTDIISSYNGLEQRIQTRQYPRHLVTYNYPSMNCYEAQWLRGLSRMRQSDVLYIPMWHNEFRLSQDYDYDPNKNYSRLYIDPTYFYELQDCNAIEVYLRDDHNQNNNIVRLVRSYGSNYIRLKNLLYSSLDKRNAFVFPLRRCSVQPMSNAQYIYSNGTNVALSFEDLLEKYDIRMSANIYSDEETEYRNRWNLPVAYGTKEVFLYTPQWVDDDSSTLSIEKAVNRIDNETGMFWYDLKNANSYDVMSFNYTLMSRQDIHNMIRFFKRMRGMWRSFYAPTWVNDIEICEDIKAGRNYIYSDFRKLKTYYINNKRRKKLIIFTKDWKSYIVDILAYLTETRTADDKQYCKIMIGVPLRETIKKENILMASYMNLVRLDSDDLQLNYETTEVANVSLTMREVDE